jgi:hypothetical protein
MKTDLYTSIVKQLPAEGRHINAHIFEDKLLVYQAYRHSIADYAIKNQCFGGTDFSFNRMSWIKTSFLWMMYRSGWAQKAGQEKVLGIWVPLTFIDKILDLTIISSYSKEFHATTEEWRLQLESSESRLQWDPDHDPVGTPISRKAIQLGLKGTLLKEFATTSIQKIEDLTPFVKEQYAHVNAGEYQKLRMPIESCYAPKNPATTNRIGLSKI